MARRKKGPIDDIKDAVGGFFGGNRGSSNQGKKRPSYGVPPDTQNEINAQTQTTFYGRGYAYYPSPQSIREMPPQLAGYDDDYNKKGQIASTANMYDVGYLGNKFLSDIQKVYINPAFAEPASRIGNDPDSKKRRTNFKPLPAYRVKGLQEVGKSMRRFADATAKYFDKDVEILQVPNQYPADAGNYLTTLQLNIHGYEQGRYPRSAGYVSMWDSWFPPSTKKTGPETRKLVGPYTANMNINTNIPKDRYPTYDVKQRAGTMTHEFMHNLGMGHPKGYDDGGAQNSKLSYDSTAYMHGEKLHPADINTFKEAYTKIDQTKMRKSSQYVKRAASAYKGVAKKRK